ncbi:hypothetical protein Gotri_016056 [Gossypium trilobum]|uniref:Uncharacterized protein n=1 Tax=Gossypium trilobum TaxID=34281 RepID=A0A7J9E248_9ROSI|nr:hypothetical protein [Gossypium trilobum]
MLLLFMLRRLQHGLEWSETRLVPPYGAALVFGQAIRTRWWQKEWRYERCCLGSSGWGLIKLSLSLIAHVSWVCYKTKWLMTRQYYL